MHTGSRQGKRDRVTVAVQQDRTGVCVCVRACVRACVHACVCGVVSCGVVCACVCVCFVWVCGR